MPFFLQVFIRSYRVHLRRASDSVRSPRAEMEEIGPSLDLVLRRSHLASDDLYKTACRYVGRRGTGDIFYQDKF